MKKLMKMLEEKDSNMKGKMSPEKSKAKMDVLKELMSMADSGEVGSMAEGLQKVTVAAKDKSGLEKGLEKAKEVVEGMPEMEDEEEEDKEEGGPLSPEEEEMLKKLLARKS
jgi:hypothetical protein